MLRRKILTAAAAIGTTAMIAATPVSAKPKHSDIVTNQLTRQYSQIVWYNGRRVNISGTDNSSFVSGISQYVTPTGRSSLPGNGKSGENNIKRIGYQYLEFIDRNTEEDKKESNGGSVAHRTTVRVTYSLQKHNGKYYIPSSWKDFLSGKIGSGRNASWRHWKESKYVLTGNTHSFKLSNQDGTLPDDGTITVTPGQAVTTEDQEFGYAHKNSFLCYFNITPSDGYIYKGEERNCHGGSTVTGDRNPHNYKIMTFRPWDPDDHHEIDKPSTLASTLRGSRANGFVYFKENGQTKRKVSNTYGRNWNSEKTVRAAVARTNSCWLGISNQGFGARERTKGNGVVNAWSGTFSAESGGKAGSADRINGGLSGYGGVGYTLRGIYHATSTSTKLNTNPHDILSGDKVKFSSSDVDAENVKADPEGNDDTDGIVERKVSGDKYTLTVYSRMTNKNGDTGRIYLPNLRNPKAYKFRGWKNSVTGEIVSGGKWVNVSPDGSVFGDDVLGFSHPVTYKAIWEPNKLIVNFHANGGKVNHRYRDANGWHDNWVDPGVITHEFKYKTNVSIENVINGHKAVTVVEGYTNGHKWNLTNPGFSPSYTWSVTPDGNNRTIDEGTPGPMSVKAFANKLGYQDELENTEGKDQVIDLYAQWSAYVDVYYNANGGTMIPAMNAEGTLDRQRIKRTTYHKVGTFGDGNGVYSMSRYDHVFRNRWICSDGSTYKVNTSYYMTARNANPATPDTLYFYADWNQRPYLTATPESQWRSGTAGVADPFTYNYPRWLAAPNSSFMQRFSGRIVIQEGNYNLNLMQFIAGHDAEDGDAVATANARIESTTYQSPNNNGSRIENGTFINPAYNKNQNGDFEVKYTTWDNDDARGGVTAEALEEHKITLRFHVNKQPHLEPTQETNYGNRLYIDTGNKYTPIDELKKRLIATDPYEDTLGKAGGYPSTSIICTKIVYNHGGAKPETVESDSGINTIDTSKEGEHLATFKITDTMKGTDTITIPVIVGSKRLDESYDTQIRFISRDFVNQILDDSSADKDDYESVRREQLKQALIDSMNNYDNKKTVATSSIDLWKSYTLKELRTKKDASGIQYVTDEEYNKAVAKGTTHDASDGKGRNHTYTNESKIFYKDYIEIVGIERAMRNRSLYTK